MKIAKDGRKSRGEKSRHIHIRYLFIKDILVKENMELIHCLIERMISGFYTKPLQDSLFRKMRDIIMGLPPFPEEERAVNSEKVENMRTKNTRKQIGKKNTYVDAVHHQPYKHENHRKLNILRV